MTTASFAYASTSHVKSRLGITDATDDVVMATLCDQVNQWVESFTGRVLAPITFTAALFDGFDALESGRLLPMPIGIRTISLLRVALYTGASLNTIPSTDYFILPASQNRDPAWPGTELWMTDIPSASNAAPYFAPGYGNIEVTGTGGWAAAPDDIVDVAVTTAVRAFQTRRTGQSDYTGTSETGEIIVSRLVSARDLHTLSRYKIKNVEVI